METPKLTELLYRKIRGGKHPLWHAFHKSPDMPNFVGAGNTADNAGKDWQEAFRIRQRREGKR